MTSLGTWLVVIEYGTNYRRDLERLLSNKKTKFNCKIIRVHNNIKPGHILKDPNEAFEFSGYQEGLGQVLEELEREKNENIEQDITITFINDTATTGHAYAISSVLIDLLLGLYKKKKNTPMMVGLRMPVNADIQEVTGQYAYLSTWAFSLSGSLDMLKSVKFYEYHETIPRFEDSVLPNLPQAYCKAVGKWLEPTRFLQGWYKAIPGQSLPKATKRRKTLSIYLEHTLPKRLTQLGFQIFDIAELLSSPSRVRLLNTLRLIDRIYVNALKIIFRLHGKSINYKIFNK